MMKCGHAANATNGKGEPCCVICAGFTPDAEIVDTAVPDLTGRTAKCVHKGCYNTWKRKRDTHYGEFGPDGQSFAPSSTNLPFFKHCPEKDYDEYFCGCFGWD